MHILFRNIEIHHHFIFVSFFTGLIDSDELAIDVTGAEALLERHQEHRTEIDARAATFQA